MWIYSHAKCDRRQSMRTTQFPLPRPALTAPMPPPHGTRKKTASGIS